MITLSHLAFAINNHYGPRIDFNFARLLMSMDFYRSSDLLALAMAPTRDVMRLLEHDMQWSDYEDQARFAQLKIWGQSMHVANCVTPNKLDIDTS